MTKMKVKKQETYHIQAVKCIPVIPIVAVATQIANTMCHLFRECCFVGFEPTILRYLAFSWLVTLHIKSAFFRRQFAPLHFAQPHI